MLDLRAMVMYLGDTNWVSWDYQKLTMRTKESIVECLEKYLVLSLRPKQTPPNFMGVNGRGLWDIDPQRIIIPILHCPMGLVDKVLESFKQWVNLEVEDFQDDAETEATRCAYRLAMQEHKEAIATHKQAKVNLQASTSETIQVAKAMEEVANKARIKASKDETKAKKLYEEQIQRHNAKKVSLNQQFESVFQRNGVKREHYHRGKFNGVNCIWIMENSIIAFF